MIKFLGRLQSIVRKERKKQQGYALLLVITVVTVLFVFVAGLTTSAINENWFARQSKNSEQAFHIAEAGINYYTWFLNHNEGDFQDGQGIAGPYTHDFTDGQGNATGRFTLEITAPQGGSTIGTIRSTGTLNDPKSLPRTIEAKIGVPSLAKFSFLTNADVWFGSSETVDGQLHSNGGIRFDGTTNSLITSAVEDYICLNYHGCADETKPGIWGSGGPSSFWEFPVPAVDFDQISSDLSDLYELAQSANGGLYLPTVTTGQYKDGYELVLTSNNTDTPADDRILVYKVKSTYSDSGQKTDGSGWVTFRDRINQKEDTPTTYNVPANGVIYVDANVWISGSTSSRLMIAAAHLPEDSSKYRSIVVKGNLTYYAQDGNTAIGLIAQDSIRLATDSPDNMTMHGVLLAQKGAVYRPYYSSSIKNSITTYGGIITNGVWTWSWFSSGTIVSGYRNTYSTYDPHLLYSPPPYFPTTGTYEVPKWEEIKAQ